MGVTCIVRLRILIRPNLIIWTGLRGEGLPNGRINAWLGFNGDAQDTPMPPRVSLTWQLSFNGIQGYFPGGVNVILIGFKS